MYKFLYIVIKRKIIKLYDNMILIIYKPKMLFFILYARMINIYIYLKIAMI